MPAHRSKAPLADCARYLQAFAPRSALISESTSWPLAPLFCSSNPIPCSDGHELDAETARAILTVEFPEGVDKRARKIISRSRARPTEKYPSWKMNQMVECESVNELNAYRLLDADPAFSAFHGQPCVIRYCVDGTVHSHFPDTLVRSHAEARELWEIKPSLSATNADTLARTRLLQAALPWHGYSYRLVFGDDLSRQPRLSNANTLLRLGRIHVDLIARERIRLFLASTGVITWGAARAGVIGPNGLSVLARLTLEGALRIDMTRPISSLTNFVASPPPIWSLT